MVTSDWYMIIVIYLVGAICAFLYGIKQGYAVTDVFLVSLLSWVGMFIIWLGDPLH